MRFFNRKISFTRTPLVMLALAMTLLCVEAKAQSQELTALNDNELKVEVFPNPTSNYLTIDLTKLSVRKPKIEIRNIIGSKMRMSVQELETKKYRVDVKDYPPGYYLVLVMDEQTKFQQTVRFSKKQ